MRFFPLPEPKLNGLEDLLGEIITDRGWPNRTISGMLETLKEGYINRNTDAYVDDVNNPRCLIAIANFPSYWKDEVLAQVVILYISPELRGNKEITIAAASLIDGYAKIRGASVVAGSARSSDDKASNFWHKSEFTAEETLYTKRL